MISQAEGDDEKAEFSVESRCEERKVRRKRM